MIIEKLVEFLPVSSQLGRLIAGAAFSVLAISLGMVAISTLLSIDLHPGIIAAFGAIGAAIYSVRHHQNKRRV